MEITTPINLVRDDVLICFDIYRSAKISEGSTVLTTGQETDEMGTPYQDGSFSWKIPSCSRTRAGGDQLHDDLYQSLGNWHSGLSCFITLKNEPKLNHSILIQVGENDFESEFNQNRSQNFKENGVSYRIMKVFELKKGISIPSGIGIELDGANHVCMYPLDTHLEVSNIAPGFESFQIECLKTLANSWKPFALVRCAGDGFQFPGWFPPSGPLFPLHTWLEYVILYGPSDVALRTSYAISDFLSICIPIKSKDQLYQYVIQLVQEMNIPIPDIRGVGIHLKKLVRRSQSIHPFQSTTSIHSSSSSSSFSLTDSLMGSRSTTLGSIGSVGPLERARTGSNEIETSEMEDRCNNDNNNTLKRKSTIFNYFMAKLPSSSNALPVPVMYDLIVEEASTDIQLPDSKNIMTVLVESEDEGQKNDEGVILLEREDSNLSYDSTSSMIQGDTVRKTMLGGSSNNFFQIAKNKTKKNISGPSPQKKGSNNKTTKTSITNYFQKEKEKGMDSGKVLEEELRAHGIDVSFFLSLPKEIQEEQLQLLRQEQQHQQGRGKAEEEGENSLPKSKKAKI